MYYAHTTNNPDKSDWQLLTDHLIQVAKLSSSFASDFNAEEFGYIAGIFHDIGKYSEKFQKRLEGSAIRVDHSTAGAVEVAKLYPKAQSLLLQYIIAGHHTGLLNYGSDHSGLCERLINPVIEDYSYYVKEIVAPKMCNPGIPVRPLNGHDGFSISFFIRMLFSCLVDADSLDTEAFMSPQMSAFRGKFDSTEVLSEVFSDFIEKITSSAADTTVNRLRKEILNQCLDKAVLSTGFFSLTVPTGGGKTLSSMAFALKHLSLNNLKRIFYVIPYTSIIEQNAKIFRDIFGEKNVLEHHSNFDPVREDNYDFQTKKDRFKVVSENWDIPITVTTNVQFFESLFGNKRSRCRKLHNLSRSVIILDEAQMLPTEYLKPSLQALSELVGNYGSTVVLCTATQPKIGDFIDKSLSVTEIMNSPQQLYEQFKRVQISHLGQLSDEDLVDHLSEHNQVLCIVNTRKHAQIIYDELSKSCKVYHLSAKMCPVHRRKVLDEIRENLSRGADCRVISTQLIEAGVDVDFPVVYRAMTGIDSIAQAAGRCNREGKRSLGSVFLFSSIEKHGKPTSWQQKLGEIGEMVMKSHEDPLSLKAIEEYFSRLYFYEGDDGLDMKNILKSLEEQKRDLSFPFEDVSFKFRLIEEDTYDVIIPYDDEAVKVIENIRKIGFPGNFARKLQGYTINIYYQEFLELEESGAVETIGERYHILVRSGLYSEQTGLIRASEEDNFGGLLIA